MSFEDFPGYFGLTSRGVVAIHADWPVYPTEHGWLEGLASLCNFPEDTTFTLVDDIDRCALLLAEEYRKKDDPYDDDNFHAALWHEDLLELVRREYATGPTGVSEAVHELNKRLDLFSQPPVTSMPDEPPQFPPLMVRIGEEEPRAFDFLPLDRYEDERRDCVCFPPDTRLQVTREGWRVLDAHLSEAFNAPAALEHRLRPILEAGLYDTAIREMSVHLETQIHSACGPTNDFGLRLVDRFVDDLRARRKLPPAVLKAFRGDLRTAFAFVRNEFAHNVIDVPRPRALALLARMTELHETVVSLEEARSG